MYAREQVCVGGTSNHARHCLFRGLKWVSVELCPVRMGYPAGILFKGILRVVRLHRCRSHTSAKKFRKDRLQTLLPTLYNAPGHTETVSTVSSNAAGSICRMGTWRPSDGCRPQHLALHAVAGVCSMHYRGTQQHKDSSSYANILGSGGLVSRGLFTTSLCSRAP